MLAQFSLAWDGHLGQISIAKYSIELLLNLNPLYSAPYQAGTTVRELQQFEIENRLSLDDIEQIQKVWAASIVYVP